MKIRNYETLAASEPRKKILEVIEAGLAAIDTRAAVRRSVSLDGGAVMVCGKRYEIAPGGRVIAVGAGKCAREAALELEAVLGARLDGGAVVDSTEGEAPARIKLFKGDHPYPSQANRDATRAILAELDALNENDLVLVVVSGGGTVMLSQSDACTSEEEAALVKALFAAGADIIEMNTIRKHLSSARGGFLAERARPARVAALIFSDVLGNDLSMISSGPTVPDSTSVADALAVVEKYKDSIGESFSASWLQETPKDPAAFALVDNNLIVSNTIALNACAERGSELGLAPRIVTDTLRGEAREVGGRVAREIAEAPRGTLLLYGGETTVAVRNFGGKGGRNQEAALGALRNLSEGAVAAFVASDGVDNGPAAGALCDTITARRAAELGLDADAFLDSNDSFAFFERAGGHIETGSTGSNVADLTAALKD